MHSKTISYTHLPDGKIEIVIGANVTFSRHIYTSHEVIDMVCLSVFKCKFGIICADRGSRIQIQNPLHVLFRTTGLQQHCWYSSPMRRD